MHTNKQEKDMVTLISEEYTLSTVCVGVYAYTCVTMPFHTGDKITFVIKS